jgi:hypothetical protein
VSAACRYRPGWRAAFFGLAAAAVVAAVAWVVLGSRLLVVRSVQVIGAHGLVTRAEVLAAARVPLGLPLVQVDGAAVARRVERLPQVQSAQVSRAWPDAVTISVRPRVPVFAVRAAAGYEVIDRFGVTVARSARRPAQLPLLTVTAPPAWPASAGAATGSGPGSEPGTAGHGRPGGGAKAAGGQPPRRPLSGVPLSGVPLSGRPLPISSLRGSRAVRAAAGVLAELPRSLARRVRAVTAAGPQTVWVRLTGGTVIVWGGTGDARAKARELAVLMRRPARLYDVSTPGVAATSG